MVLCDRCLWPKFHGREKLFNISLRACGEIARGQGTGYGHWEYLRHFVAALR